MVTSKYYAEVQPDGVVVAGRTRQVFIDFPQPEESVEQLEPTMPGNAMVEVLERVVFDPPTPTSVLRVIDRKAQYVEEGSIEQIQARKWEQIKAERTKAELSDFIFQGKMYQANKEQINGYVTMAMVALQFGQPFSQKWTLKDNSVETFDASRMIALGVALGNHIAGIYDKGRDLRAAIYSPEATLEQIDAISWNTEGNGNA